MPAAPRGSLRFLSRSKERVLVTEVLLRRNFRRAAATCGWPTWKEASKTGTACAAAAPLRQYLFSPFSSPILLSVDELRLLLFRYNYFY